ncbi:MAG: hypothetical protein LCH46_01460 [Proteobacteria bacterium]|nr:hypothetical protein [Pseudomonadota bacterium]
MSGIDASGNHIGKLNWLGRLVNWLSPAKTGGRVEDNRNFIFSKRLLDGDNAEFMLRPLLEEANVPVRAGYRKSAGHFRSRS